MKNKGFTLIELLAVITIMGILMLIAIPAVSRTIENSRKATFANTALSYLNAVKKAVQEDQLYCMDSTGNESVISSKPVTTSNVNSNSYLWNTNVFGYYYYFWSGDSTGQNLLESGGKSPWQSNEIKGIVLILKTEKDGIINYNYSMFITDEAGYGFGTTFYPGNGYMTYNMPGLFIYENSIGKKMVVKSDSRKNIYNNFELIQNSNSNTNNYYFALSKDGSSSDRSTSYMKYYKCRL